MAIDNFSFSPLYLVIKDKKEKKKKKNKENLSN